jgi:hypothetical protein
LTPKKDLFCGHRFCPIFGVVSALFNLQCTIGKYTGRRVTKNQLDQQYGSATAKYAVCNRSGQCINYTTDAAPRFSNDARKHRFKIILK